MTVFSPRLAWIGLPLLASCGPACDSGIPLDSTGLPTDSGTADSADSALTETGEPGPFVFERIILLTLDATRADRFTDEHMPFLMARAREGTVLNNHWSHSWTYPGVGSMLTGLAPVHWDDASWGRGETGSETATLSAEVPLLAAKLLGQGWATAYWSSSVVASTGTELHRGYESFTAFQRGNGVDEFPSMISWLQETQDKPQLLHLHSNDVHSPYDQTDPACIDNVESADNGSCRYDFRHDHDVTFEANEDVAAGAFGPEESDYQACVDLLVAAYDCGVRSQDSVLEALWKELGDAGFLKGAIVVVATDHGEGLLDPYTNHAFDMRLPVTKSWAMFWAPGLVPVETITTPTDAIDITPSTLMWANTTIDVDFDGIPYTEATDDRLLLHFWFGSPPGQNPAIIDDGYLDGFHYIQYSTGAQLLYDVVADPGELRNLLDEGGTAPEGLIEAVQAQALETDKYLP